MLYQYLTLVIFYIGGVISYFLAKRGGGYRGYAVFIAGVLYALFAFIFVVGTAFAANWPWYMVMIGVIGIMSMPAGVWLGSKHHKRFNK